MMATIVEGEWPEDLEDEELEKEFGPSKKRTGASDADELEREEDGEIEQPLTPPCTEATQPDTQADKLDEAQKKMEELFVSVPPDPVLSDYARMPGAQGFNIGHGTKDDEYRLTVGPMMMWGMTPKERNDMLEESMQIPPNRHQHVWGDGKAGFDIEKIERESAEKRAELEVQRKLERARKLRAAQAVAQMDRNGQLPSVCPATYAESLFDDDPCDWDDWTKEKLLTGCTEGEKKYWEQLFGNKQ